MINRTTKLAAVLAAALLLTACAPVGPVENTTAPTTQTTTAPTTVPTTVPATTQPEETAPVILEANGWIYTAADTPEAAAQSAVEGLVELAGIDSIKIQFASPHPSLAELYIERLLNGTYENKEKLTKEYLQTHFQIVAVPYTVVCGEAASAPRIKDGNYQMNFAMLLDDSTGLWHIWGEQTPSPDKAPRTGWYRQSAETPEAAAQGTVESLKDSYAIVNVEVLRTEYDSELTAINIKQLKGSDLVKDMGLTDAELETCFKIIRVTYELTVDQDIPDRRFDNGKFECRFDMVQDPETGLWRCYDSMINTLEDYELPG